MHYDRVIIIAGWMLIIAAMTSVPITGEAQESQSRLAHANGTGTLKVGGDTFKLSAAVVKLLPDQKAEISLISDITIFLEGTWSNHSDSQQEFDLETTRGGLDGTGRVLLSNDGKTVARLTLKGISRATKRAVEANFEGK